MPPSTQLLPGLNWLLIKLPSKALSQIMAQGTRRPCLQLQLADRVLLVSRAVSSSALQCVWTCRPASCAPLGQPLAAGLATTAVKTHRHTDTHTRPTKAALFLHPSTTGHPWACGGTAQLHSCCRLPPTAAAVAGIGDQASASGTTLPNPCSAAVWSQTNSRPFALTVTAHYTGAHPKSLS